MTKIIILTDKLTLHGGIESLIAIKANYWSAKFNYSVKIITTENKGNESIYELDSLVKIIDLDINYNRSISYLSYRNLLLLLKNIYKLQQYILKHSPDSIIVASHIPMTYILPFLILKKTKIVKEFHFTQYFRKKESDGFKNKLFKYIENMYYKLIVLSSEEASYYKSNNVEIIPNPVFENISIKKNYPKKIASAVVRFAPVKRLELMFEAWKIFIEKGNKDWKLYIYGDYSNEYGFEMVELVKELKISNNIIFKGQTTNIKDEIAKSRILLLTSSQECFPMVILEAHSVGLPVISFDCPTGPRNIINNFKDGILVENDNVTMFAEALNTFALDSKLQNKLSKNALINAQKYSIDKVMNLWKEKVFI